MKDNMLSSALCILFICFQGNVVGFSSDATRRNQQLLSTRKKATCLASARDATENEDTTISRRALISTSLVSLAIGGAIYKTRDTMSPSTNILSDDDFEATSLPLLSLEDAYALTTRAPQDIFPFAHWPDPILRRPASVLPMPLPDREADFLVKIRAVARTLQRTAHQKGAVGLAAQQCGIDVSLVYLQQTNKQRLQVEGIFLLNPRIVQRSSELDMLVWTEECLVLPPSFRATLLRDAEVTVEYETIFPGKIPALSTQQVALKGELARAVQHEMQHDQGILIVDHLELEALPSYMQDVEAEGHGDRMAQAFDRSVSVSSLSSNTLQTATKRPQYERSPWQELVVPTANAQEEEEATMECDESCRAERKRIIEERRAMMKQSRTNTRRQDVFELSQQRAAMYNTTYRGAQCAPGIPCI